MATFNEILTAAEEDLVRIFYRYRGQQETHNASRICLISRDLQLRTAQLVTALGFNPVVPRLVEILPILGYDSLDTLLAERNEYFINDIYKKLSLDNILAIYTAVKDNDEFLQIMPYLLKNRLHTIESRIEATVNSLIIDKYKAEMRAIYSEHIVDIEFVEARLDQKDSGFRALLNEVTIITESRIIPAGDIFFRNTVLPEEKRKLLNRGLIPNELIEARLEDESASTEEKHMLYEYLKYKK